MRKHREEIVNKRVAWLLVMTTRSKNRRFIASRSGNTFGGTENRIESRRISAEQSSQVKRQTFGKMRTVSVKTDNRSDFRSSDWHAQKEMFVLTPPKQMLFIVFSRTHGSGGFAI